MLPCLTPLEMLVDFAQILFAEHFQSCMCKPAIMRLIKSDMTVFSNTS